jgi:hypothetical protein
VHLWSRRQGFKLSYRILFDAFSTLQAIERIVISNNEIDWTWSGMRVEGSVQLTYASGFRDAYNRHLQIFAGGSGDAATNPGQDLE